MAVDNVAGSRLGASAGRRLAFDAFTAQKGSRLQGPRLAFARPPALIGRQTQGGQLGGKGALLEELHHAGKVHRRLAGLQGACRGEGGW